MRLIVNGDARELPDGQTVATLVAGLEVRGRIAVEVNGELVPRSRYAVHLLRGDDCVEIVHAIGGGAAAGDGQFDKAGQLHDNVDPSVPGSRPARYR